MEFAFLAIPDILGEARLIFKFFEQPCFLNYLWASNIGGLKFDSHLPIVMHVKTEVDLSETSGADLLTHFELVGHPDLI